MNFGELKSELFARGTNYLEEDVQETARAERWLNQGYREIVNLHSWPFLKASVTGAAGSGIVSVPDLRKVLLVGDVSGGQTPGNRLRKVLYEDLAMDDGVADINATGRPEFYWIESGNIIHSYPVGGTVFVHYIKRIDPLAGTAVPVFDEEYHNLIVDKAMIHAYIDSDNFEAAGALRQLVNEGLAAMAEDYQLDSREASYIPVDPYDG